MTSTDLPPLKSHQLRTIANTAQTRYDFPGQPIVVVGPTGCGKSRMMFEEIISELDRGGSVIVLAHRKMLLEQLEKGLIAAGISFGVISTEHKPDDSKRVQLAMSQTLYSRAIMRSTIPLPKATLVLVDEWHQQLGKVMRSLSFGTRKGTIVTDGWIDEGADIVGYTATPAPANDGQEIAQHMVQAGSYSEMRRAKMHLPIEVYGPTEIDTSRMKANAAGEYSEKQLEKSSHLIFGSVYHEWKNMNKDALPAILFGPSVPASKWFAYEYAKRGVRVAHMDGDQCILPDGDSAKLSVYPSDREIRDQILEMSRTGEIQMVCHRFLLREAIDMPWLYHGIFATVFGSLTTALQSVGRLQRYWPGYSHKLLQDHGGFVWRHGHPDEDRVWRLGSTAKQAKQERIDRILAGEIQEGIRCPKCGYWRRVGGVCLNQECRHTHWQSVRTVMSVSGRLKHIPGSVFTAPSVVDQVQRLWTSTLFSSGPKGRSVSSAVSIFMSKAEKAGLKVDWSKLKHKPPAPNTQEWHLTVAAVYPWSNRARKKKEEAAK